MIDTERGPARKLSKEERFLWGRCPTCRVAHGEPCLPGVGLHFGTPTKGGGHLSRLRRAPFVVQEVDVG